ncbi:MAG: MFS transporter [Planctomycetaceae bacterium]
MPSQQLASNVAALFGTGECSRRFLTPMTSATPDNQKVYDRTFWIAYVANLMLVTSNAMTFRFAEFVRVFGGTEKTAGFIVGCGTFAALGGRLFLGQAIDRLGVRRSWMTVAALFVIGCVLIASVDSIGPLIYVGRVFFAIGLAGMFTCSIFHAQNRAPVARRTEVIGNLGSSGFLGMICGSQLCDLVGRTFDGRTESLVAFGCVAGLATVYLILVTIITRNDVHSRPADTPGPHRLILRHWPGPVVIVALLMGMYFIIPSVFLTRFSTHRGLGGIALYWTCYSMTAFAVRILTRRWSQTVGRHRMILIGTVGHFVGFGILPSVTLPWHFVFPALCSGFAHALLFPAVVSLGTESFPREYRGTGTTLVLGFFDLGGALSAPVLGAIIDHFGGTGFAQMFYASASVSVLVGLAYWFTGSKRPDADLVSTTTQLPVAGLGNENAEKGVPVHR